MTLGAALADEEYCYLTTTGRVSGQPREIEIWFGLADGKLYVLSGGRDRSHWVRNIMAEASVSVRIGEATFHGEAHIVPPGSEEDALARRLLVAKYNPGRSGDLTDWGQTSLPVVVEMGSQGHVTSGTC